MSYDLTAFLTTVVASSASIVAILGGFIASKLITISGEREAVLEKLNSIEEELRFKTTERESRQKENDISDALSFIRDNIEAVNNQNIIDLVYDTANNHSITKERLKPYWERALSISKELCEMGSDGMQFNSDGLPKDLARKYSNDAFSYNVLFALMRFSEKIAREEERRRREELRKNSPLASLVPLSFDESVFRNNIEYIEPLTSTYSYSQNEQEIVKLTSDILFLEFQKGQLEKQRKILSQPKGMKTGLIIFAIFAIICIIIPLAMSPWNTESLCTFWLVKSIILILFVVGLVAIFAYLVYLLQWKNNSENKDWQ